MLYKELLGKKRKKQKMYGKSFKKKMRKNLTKCEENLQVVDIT
jgi:hypothetical protein